MKVSLITSNLRIVEGKNPGGVLHIQLLWKESTSQLRLIWQNKKFDGKPFIEENYENISWYRWDNNYWIHAFLDLFKSQAPLEVRLVVVHCCQKGKYRFGNAFLDTKKTYFNKVGLDLGINLLRKGIV